MRSTRSTRRRLSLAVLGSVVVFAVFVMRLVDIQVVHAEALNTDAYGKRAVPITTYGTRGDIVDGDGVVLADSVDRFDITAVPMYAGAVTRTRDDGTQVELSVEEVVAEVAAITGADAAGIMAALTEDPDANWALLVPGVDLATYEAVRALGVDWIYYEQRPSRTYPLGAVAGNLVGFLGTDGPQTGTEYRYDHCLASTDGTSTYERGRDGVRLPGSTVVETAPKDGATVRLTIDSDLQWYTQQVLAEEATRLRAEWATAMVVRVSDGKVMAAADWPSVDPNDIDASEIDDIGSRLFTAPYEPGSTFKAMTFAMLLDQGLVTPHDRLTVPSLFRVPGTDTTIRDSVAHGTVQYTAAGVLAHSSNIGTSMLSERMSKQQRYDYMKAFGVGEPTAVDFLGEADNSGYVASPDSVDIVTNYNQMFGQGVTATSAQVASIFQTLANGGVRLPLTLVEGCEWPDGSVTDTPPTEGTRVVSEQAAATTVAMLEKVATAGSLAGLVDVPGYRVAVKSGTAEVAENGRYTSDRIISVAGMAPAEDPEYVVTVTFAKPQASKWSSAAAPAFTEILTQVLKAYRVVPSTEAAPDIPLTW